MLSRPLTVTFDAHDPARLATFWAGLLGREIVQDGGGALLPGDDPQLSLRFVPSRAEKRGPNPVHLHLTSASDDDQQGIVATALGLGAGHLDLGQRPEEGHIVLADPEGNEFCVIEAGNAYLAGCGPLGEIACDGTREVGLFWSAALDWPLVWTRTRRPRSSHRSGVRRSPGVARRWPRKSCATGSASTSPRPAATSGRWSTGWSPWGRPGSRSPGTARSSWPTRTAPSSASAGAEPTGQASLSLADQGREERRVSGGTAGMSRDD